MPFIDAYRTDTGQKVRVPESHLYVFPGVFARDIFPGVFAPTPRQKAAEKKAARAAVTTPAEAPVAADNPQEDAS